MSNRLLTFAVFLKESWERVSQPIQLGVRLILVQEGEVLLVRHTYMEGWHFPGGSMKRWETPLEAAAREAREEVGAELLEPPLFVGIYSTFHGGKSDHVATYLCRNYRIRRATDKWEIAEVKCFALNALPSQLPVGWQEYLRRLRENDDVMLDYK